MRTFVELVERYINPEFCPYPEYKGKPYYSIKYIENGEEYVGYSTYSLQVMSEFLKKYFISSALEKQTCDGCIFNKRWKEDNCIDCARKAIDKYQRPLPEPYEGRRDGNK